MANRRFTFVNAMIKLLWVSDRREAQTQSIIQGRPCFERGVLVAKTSPVLSALACGSAGSQETEPPFG
jgi:hypothetical protein